MTYSDPDGEGTLELNTMELLKSLGWQVADCYHETFGVGASLGRDNTAQAVLESRLREAIVTLNPGLSTAAADLAVAELVKDRSVLSPVRANQEVYQLLKDGVKVTFRTDDDVEAIEVVKIIDWETPEHNDFFLASQFWISGDYGKKRADLLGFVNGIPLVFIELKASHKSLENAYKHNLSDYKTTIPQLFWYNAAVILSNGSKSKIGSVTAGWEHFAEWKKINDEGEEGVVSLETIVRGVCDKTRLLDRTRPANTMVDGAG
jgi:type I restriction enzyme R subunit